MRKPESKMDVTASRCVQKETLDRIGDVMTSKVGKKASVKDLVRKFAELQQSARSVDELREKLPSLLRTWTACPDCAADFVFNDALRCNDADRSYEFFCPACGIRFTGIRTMPTA